LVFFRLFIDWVVLELFEPVEDILLVFLIIKKCPEAG
jgi:hypothetical protein